MQYVCVERKVVNFIKFSKVGQTIFNDPRAGLSVLHLQLDMLRLLDLGRVPALRGQARPPQVFREGGRYDLVRAAERFQRARHACRRAVV